MISEHDIEPVPGLPGRLPPGETMLWQGAPDWRRLAISAFHVRIVGLYFLGLSAFGLLQGSWMGTAITLVAGAACIGLLLLGAWGVARTTLYTITSRRVVLRIGIALPKCINLPLSLIESADLALRPDGTGDLALTVTGTQRVGYLALWPHARPWRLAVPHPMLRGLADAQSVAATLARACGVRLNAVPVETPAALAA